MAIFTFRIRSFSLAGLGILLATIGTASAQQIADSVHTLDIEAGERALDFKMGSLSARGEGRSSEAQLGIAYGMSTFWRTKFTAEYERSTGEGTRLDALEWENRFRLPLDPAMWPALGFLAELEWAKNRDDGYRVKLGPLVQVDAGKTQWNFNLLFERHLGETPSRHTEISYQWQAKYDWRERMQFGLQGFGEMGEWDDWAAREDQSHRFGPAIFGEMPLGDGKKVQVNAAYLGDYSARSRSDGFRVQVEYAF